MLYNIEIKGQKDRFTENHWHNINGLDINCSILCLDFCNFIVALKSFWTTRNNNSFNIKSPNGAEAVVSPNHTKTVLKMPNYNEEQMNTVVLLTIFAEVYGTHFGFWKENIELFYLFINLDV